MHRVRKNEKPDNNPIVDQPIKRGHEREPEDNPIVLGRFILHYPYAYAVTWRLGCCHVGVMAEMLGQERSHS